MSEKQNRKPDWQASSLFVFFWKYKFKMSKVDEEKKWLEVYYSKAITQFYNLNCSTVNI